MLWAIQANFNAVYYSSSVYFTVVFTKAEVVICGRSTVLGYSQRRSKKILVQRTDWVRYEDLSPRDKPHKNSGGSFSGLSLIFNSFSVCKPNEKLFHLLGSCWY